MQEPHQRWTPGLVETCLLHGSASPSEKTQRYLVSRAKSRALGLCRRNWTDFEETPSQYRLPTYAWMTLTFLSSSGLLQVISRARQSIQAYRKSCHNWAPLSTNDPWLSHSAGFILWPCDSSKMSQTAATSVSLVVHGDGQGPPLR